MPAFYRHEQSEIDDYISENTRTAELQTFRPGITCMQDHNPILIGRKAPGRDYVKSSEVK